MWIEEMRPESPSPNHTMRRAVTYRSSSPTKHFQITVNGKGKRATAAFDKWRGSNTVKVGSKERHEKGLLLFVYTALHDKTSVREWVAQKDEKGEDWGSSINQHGTTFTYNGKSLHISFRTEGESFSLKDLNGKMVSFERQSTSKGLQLSWYQFEHPIFFCPEALLVNKQEKANPVMLVSAEDWKELKRPEATHQGAFGNDFQKVASDVISRAKIGTYDPRGVTWWVVWKFPGDLNYLTGFKRIHHPIPVGAYPLLSDGWWNPPMILSSPKLPVNDYAPVEKIRLDRVSPSVHFLQGDHGECAMVGSHYFIDGFWESNLDLRNIKRMLQELYNVGVYAFTCYGQHHAIVLYADLTASPPELLTPQRLATLLHNPSKKRKIVDALQMGALDGMRSQLQKWATNYVEAFGDVHPM